MRHAIVSGIIAGLAAAIAIGFLLTAIVPSDVGLSGLTLMELLAATMTAQSVAPGWIAILVVGALLGAIFGALVGPTRGVGHAASGALFFGLAVWAIVAVTGVPLLMGARPFTGLANIRAWPLLVGTLMLHLLFSSILVATFLQLRGERRGATATEGRELRRAA